MDSHHRYSFSGRRYALLIFLLWALCGTFAFYRVQGNEPVLLSLKLLIILLPSIGLLSFAVLSYHNRGKNTESCDDSQHNLTAFGSPLILSSRNSLISLEIQSDHNENEHEVGSISRTKSLPDYEPPPTYTEVVEFSSSPKE